MIRWFLIIALSLSLVHCTGNTPNEQGNFSEELLESYQATVLADAKAQQKELRSYLRVLRSIAENPPINDEVSDSIAYQIAVAIYLDSRQTELPASFYLGLLRVENPQLEPYICNWYGACGLTQVVPKYWLGAFPECGLDLEGDIYTQICYGARVYLTYFEIWGDETLALYAYNGCTEAHRARRARCISFPTWVQEYAQAYAEELN